MDDVLTAYPELEAPDEDGTIWILDTGRMADHESSAVNMETENYGSCGFGPLTFEIYKLK